MIIVRFDSDVKQKGSVNMSMVWKRVIILAVIVIVAAVLGRLAVRAFLNLLLGGTMFGGNFLLVGQTTGRREPCLGV